MSISIAIDFAKILQQALESNQDLALHVKHIYSSPQPCAKYPYIYHAINSIKVIASSNVDTYEIQGEVNLYIRSNTQTNAQRQSEILTLIESILRELDHATHQSDFKFISSKINEAEFLPSNDQLTLRIKAGFFAVVQESKLTTSSNEVLS